MISYKNLKYALEYFDKDNEVLGLTEQKKKIQIELMKNY